MIKDTSIFKEYDIRGIYPKEINEKMMPEIADGIVTALHLKSGDKIAVGRDSRESSPKLAKAFIDAILNNDIEVIDVGEITTPMLYFSVTHLQTKGGVMITASHNPMEYNGVKVVNGNAEAISGLRVKDAISNSEFLISNKTQNSSKLKNYKKIQTTHYNISPAYLSAMYHDFTPPKNSKLKYEFDYDGDRIKIRNPKSEIRNKETQILNSNEFIRGDILGSIIADSFVKKGDVILYGINCSKAIPRYFRNKGVIAIPTRVGHANVTHAMREKKAVFALELSGHYYFQKFNYCEAPLYAISLLSEKIDKNGENLDDLIKPFSKVFHSGEINFSLKSQDDIEKILTKLKDNYRNGAHSNQDGLTIELSSWWLNIRPSKTEPLLRLVVEANNERLLEEKVKEISGIIEK